jgi:hypothetical protein
MSEQSPVSHRTELSDALNFTTDDLEANRAGRLSPAQQDRLRRGFRRALIIGIIALILIGLGAAVFIYMGQQNNTVILTLLGFALTVINAAIVGLLIQNWLRLQGDLSNPPQIQDGIVRRTLRIAGRHPTYILTFDGDQLVVNKPTFNAFIEGAVYKLYRAATSKMLLSAELVGMLDE